MSSYVKVGWKDYPDTSTPVNAENLNHMDEQISLSDKDVEDLKNETESIKENLGGFSLVSCTESEYDALTSKSPTTIYLIKADEV